MLPCRSSRWNPGSGVMLIGLICLAALAGATGCRSYHWGSLMQPQVKTIAIGMFQNPTEEPTLGPVLRRKLAEQFMTDGSLRVTDSERADAVVRGRIVACRFQATARSKTRDDRALADERDAYQPTAFQAEVEVEFEVIVPGRDKPLVSQRRVIGKGNFTRLPDLEVPRQEGVGLALNDAAIKVVSSVTEAW